jgi:hypothetical protein
MRALLLQALFSRLPKLCVLTIQKTCGDLGPQRNRPEPLFWVSEW